MLLDLDLNDLERVLILNTTFIELYPIKKKTKALYTPLYIVYT